MTLLTCRRLSRQIGINPGLFAAYKGHHYAGPGNHFCKSSPTMAAAIGAGNSIFDTRNDVMLFACATGKCLYLAGLVPEPMTADDDFKLLHYGIGFTNMVARATKGSADLTRKEIREGGRILLEKLQRFRPKIAVFNGKGIYEVFSGKKEFTFGKQPEYIDGTNTVIDCWLILPLALLNVSIVHAVHLGDAVVQRPLRPATSRHGQGAVLQRPQEVPRFPQRPHPRDRRQRGRLQRPQDPRR